MNTKSLLRGRCKNSIFRMFKYFIEVLYKVLLFTNIENRFDFMKTESCATFRQPNFGYSKVTVMKIEPNGNRTEAKIRLSQTPKYRCPYQLWSLNDQAKYRCCAYKCLLNFNSITKQAETLAGNYTHGRITLRSRLAVSFVILVPMYSCRPRGLSLLIDFFHHNRITKINCRNPFH